MKNRRPEKGTVRALNHGEAEATGLTESCLVYVCEDDDVHIFLPCVRNTTPGFIAATSKDLEFFAKSLETEWNK